MTQFTDRIPTVPERRTADAHRSSGASNAFVGGVVAAGLGLGAFTVAVLFVWISSPYPDRGLNGALHVAADLWLLAHGADLVRTQALSGAASPIGVTPLLLTALPAWLLYQIGVHSAVPPEEHEDADRDDLHVPAGRAGRAGPDATGRTDEPGRARGDGEDWEDGVDSGQGDSGAAGPEPSAALIAAMTSLRWLVAGYLAIGAAAAIYTSYGPVRSDPLSVVLHLPLFAVLAAGAGVWSASGRPPIVLPRAVRRRLATLPLRPLQRLERLQRMLRRLPPGGPAEVLRAAAAATAVLIGGGALLAAGALAWHAGPVGQTFTQLSGQFFGQCAVLLVAVALVPNVAVWGASYAVGPGFAIGTGCVAAPGAVTGHPALPVFPWLAAVPGPAAGTPLTWAVLVVPGLAGTAVAWFVSHVAARNDGEGGSERWTWRQTAAVAALAAACCGVAMASLAAWAAGPMGAGRLSDFGPDWWAVGPVAMGWTALIGVPGALVVRWWRVREQREPRERETGVPTPVVPQPVVPQPVVPEPVAPESGEREKASWLRRCLWPTRRLTVPWARFRAWSRWSWSWSWNWNRNWNRNWSWTRSRNRSWKWSWWRTGGAPAADPAATADPAGSAPRRGLLSKPRLGRRRKAGPSGD